MQIDVFPSQVCSWGRKRRIPDLRPAGILFLILFLFCPNPYSNNYDGCSLEKIFWILFFSGDGGRPGRLPWPLLGLVPLLTSGRGRFLLWVDSPFHLRLHLVWGPWQQDWLSEEGGRPSETLSQKRIKLWNTFIVGLICPLSSVKDFFCRLLHRRSLQNGLSFDSSALLIDVFKVVDSSGSQLGENVISIDLSWMCFVNQRLQKLTSRCWCVRESKWYQYQANINQENLFVSDIWSNCVSALVRLVRGSAW